VCIACFFGSHLSAPKFRSCDCLEAITNTDLHKYIHTYAYQHMYMFIHTYAFKNMYVFMSMYMHEYVYVHANMYMYAYAYLHACVCVCVYVYDYIRWRAVHHADSPRTIVSSQI